MRSLPLVLVLLCSTALAEDVPGKVSPGPERGDSLVVPAKPDGLRSSGDLDLAAAAATVDAVAERGGAGIPSNDPPNALVGERSAWRLREPIGYYPADRGVSKRF